jgi:hypothetical protein
MNFSDHDGSRAVENKLHSMRGDASRAPDMTADILSRVAQQRPFADARTLRLRRWSRLVGVGFAAGIAVCGTLVAVQWKQISPGFADKRPVGGVVSSAVADVRAGSQTFKSAQQRLAQLARVPEMRTDPEDSTVVRAVATNVIVPMSEVLHVTPSLEPTQAEQNFAQKVLASGQRLLNTAERYASSLRVGGGGIGAGDLGGSETFADRLGRAVGGTPLGDGGPQ